MIGCLSIYLLCSVYMRAFWISIIPRHLNPQFMRRLMKLHLHDMSYFSLIPAPWPHCSIKQEPSVVVFFLAWGIFRTTSCHSFMIVRDLKQLQDSSAWFEAAGTNQSYRPQRLYRKQFEKRFFGVLFWWSHSAQILSVKIIFPQHPGGRHKWLFGMLV